MAELARRPSVKDLAIPKFLLRKKGMASTKADVLPTETFDWDDFPLPKGLRYCRIWFLEGIYPQREASKLRFCVKDPPFCGTGNVFLIQKDKRTIILDPSTLKSWNVPTAASQEVASAEDEPFRCSFMVDLLTRRWTMLKSNGLQADYDMAAVVLRMLGASVPADVELKTEVAARRPPKKEGPSGGKPASSKLLKPVAKTSKRGKILEFFLRDGAGQPRSIREAMAEFETTRSNVLSTLFNLNKDHGIGYTLEHDAAKLDLPKGKLWS